jgi:hypothetical protein
MLQPTPSFSFVRNSGCLDFVHHLLYYKTQWNTMFRKLDLFPSSGEEGDTYSVGSFRPVLGSMTSAEVETELLMCAHIRNVCGIEATAEELTEVSGIVCSNDIASNS